MWLLFLLACGGPLGAPDDTAVDGGCFSNPGAVEVGGGSLTYEPVADGTDLTMVHGPQGGWHVLAGARFTDVSPIVEIHYTIEARSPEGEVALVSDNSYRVQMVQDVECGGFYPGMYGYLNVTALVEGERDTPPELIAGHELVLTMAVTDQEGRTATDALTGIAALDPMDEDMEE
ncbi:MAG: hypothetical protein V4850_05010 [Myxococcota bacterium]